MILAKGVSKHTCTEHCLFEESSSDCMRTEKQQQKVEIMFDTLINVIM